MNKGLNEHFLKVTPLSYKHDSSPSNELAGTGFFFQTQYAQSLDVMIGTKSQEEIPPRGPYLVTNKHVLENRYGRQPDRIEFFLRDKPDYLEPERYEIPLFNENDERRWLEHPNDKVDIAIILLDYHLGPKFTYTREDIPQSGNEVSGGDSTQTVGYPRWLPEFQHFPILRSGLISSPYSIAMEEADFFYFDARLHSGMSGSPVLAVPINYLPIENADIRPPQDIDSEIPFEELDIDVASYWADSPTRSYLLGIHSDERIMENNKKGLEYYEKVDELKEGSIEKRIFDLEIEMEMLSNSTGLNVAWHSSAIIDIIENSNIDESDAVEPVRSTR